MRIVNNQDQFFIGLIPYPKMAPYGSPYNTRWAFFIFPGHHEFIMEATWNNIGKWNGIGGICKKTGLIADVGLLISMVYRNDDLGIAQLVNANQQEWT